MAAGLIIPVSGAAVGTWNALPLGTLNDQGYQLSCTIVGQEVNASDAFGGTLVEGIIRGQNWKATVRGLEWNKTGLLSILQMFGGGAGGTTLTPTLANIGDRWTKFCQALVLTSILGSPPSTPQTLTAVNAGFSPNSTTAFNITSMLREMPLELVLIPYQSIVGSVTNNIPFSTTG